MWRDPGTPADSYYQVRPECTDVPKTKFTIKVCKTFKCSFCNLEYPFSGFDQNHITMSPDQNRIPDFSTMQLTMTQIINKFT